MKPFTVLTGIVAPLEALNVDTDQIIPKQFLKRIERTGYENFLFFDWRYRPDGSPNPDFEMNAPRYKGAKILLTKDNFGCGSSREHAPWALENYGFRCILAPSFADIFFNNCFNNGLLPIVLPGSVVEALFQEVRALDGYRLTIDLPAQRIVKPNGEAIPFEIHPFKKECLINGWDPISLTLRHEDKICAYEKRRGMAETCVNRA
ncbi:MAG TPA: 3-isopropylmalate dehydratase small subunit [Candidatus Hydrogenedentes bacterium]|nr:3-isopropylmalate dehydratase small subunit [Candidatus Hydrogenedentota bacterium]HRT20915.1 3-isopropylmalate dehydratase small subunit [Candidatus Hydrogenedentota bacterium]HRT63438.1 3-isopropylmalate dehydratase small subunit [Candidatus Hydrogenedentota bacterium]